MGNVYVQSLAYSGNNIFTGTTLSGVYLSTNNGTSWTQTLNVQYVNTLAGNGNNIFAGTQNSGVYLSTNNGTSWTQTSLNNQNIASLAINGSNIFAGTYGVYLSTNNGTTWTQTSLNNQRVWSLAVNGNNIFAGIRFPANGVYLSTNNGASWTQTSLNNQFVSSLAANGNNVFVTAVGNGFYVSTDNGTTWTQRNEGLGNHSARRLCVLNNYIFAGTDSSVYRRPLDELTGIQPISNEIPNQFSLSQNYPNPFNPTTNIHFATPRSSFVKLIVYDILGREVEILVNENLSAGTYNADWNAAKYSSGVYFYKLETEVFSEIKKMVMVK